MKILEYKQRSVGFNALQALILKYCRANNKIKIKSICFKINCIKKYLKAKKHNNTKGTGLAWSVKKTQR